MTGSFSHTQQQAEEVYAIEMGSLGSDGHHQVAPPPVTCPDSPRGDRKSYRAGYPRYAALLGSDSSFQNFRRFTRVRLRLQLTKQYEISKLEDKLDRIDAAESCNISLGCLRLDTNPERAAVMKSLTTSLAEYDDILMRNSRTLRLPRSTFRDIQNLKDWTDETGCISRQETAYLYEQEDLANLTESLDTAIIISESLFEDCLFWLDRWVGEYCPAIRSAAYRMSEEDHVLFLGPYLRQLSRAVVTVVATVVILAPTIVLPSISGLVGRIFASFVLATIFLLVVSFCTMARTVDLFTVGASYTAILVALNTAGYPSPSNCSLAC